MVRAHAALALPGGHGAAQVIGFAGGISGSLDGHVHHLLLEDRNAQGALQHFPDLAALAGVVRIVEAAAAAHQFPPPQIGVDHAALDGARPHDGHLHHQVVLGARLHARQHAHLGAAFDLEHADGIGLADHVERGRIFTRNVVHLHDLRQAAPQTHQFQRAAQGGQHAQRQDVDLEQLQ